MADLSRPAALAWRWLLPEDEQRFTTFVAASPPAPVHPGTVAAELTRVGGESAAVILLIGWTPLALELLATDRRLCRRTVVWAIAEGDLAAAHACADRLRQVLPRLLVAPYAATGDLSRIVSRLPLLGWSAAVLSDDPELHRQIPLLRNWSLSVESTPPARMLAECRNFLAREARLGDAVALTSWRGGWAGRTALCLAGGPGLDRDLAFVRRWMDACVVIAADVVATRLARSGIKIDFIINADAHADVATRVEPSADPATILVMPLTGHAELDQRCARRSYEGADPLAGHVLGRDHAYTHGTNVGSCTVGFAEYLGCDEIVLIGHDLSFAPDAYYSTCVAGHAALQASSLAHAAGFSVLTVPGNGGGQVRTTHAFVHGISDLGGFAASFVRRGGRMHNCNCNAGTGALIPFTTAVPTDWRPAGTGASPRPGAGTTLAQMWRGSPPPPLRALAGPACAAYGQALRALPADPAAFLRAALDLGQGGEPDLGHALLAPFCRPALLQLACLLAEETPPGGAALASAMRLDVFAAVERGTAVVDQTLDGGWSASPPSTTSADAVADELAGRAPVLPPQALAATLLPLIRRDLRDACALDPAFPTPRASGVVDGVHLLAALAGTAPTARLEELLCLAALLPSGDPLRYVIEVAERHGVTVAPGSVPAAATAAVLAVRGDAAAIAEHCRRALTWPSVVPQLVENLAAGTPEHRRVLEQLAADGSLVLDDATAARLIVAGVALPADANLTGPRTILATSERAAAAGRWAAAEVWLADLPLLHPIGIDAVVLRCRCAFHRAGEDALMAVINDLPEVWRVAALHGFFVAEEGPAQAIVHLAELGIAPVPAALLASSLRACLAAGGDVQTRQTLCQVHLALLSATQAAVPPPGELAELAATVTLAERALAILAR